MKLYKIRLSNFQSFGVTPIELEFEDITYLIGPNGSGKTAALQALCRMFASHPSLRRVQRSDFHVSHGEQEAPEERRLWIEADFLFPELKDDLDNSTVPPFFNHMRLDDPDEIPRVRYRLSATMGLDEDIEEKFEYVLEVNSDGSPLTVQTIPRSERNYIQVHYLPAKREPSDHIAYGANALLGRLMRAINWSDEHDMVKGLADQISEGLVANPSISVFNQHLKNVWGTLHQGGYFIDPKVTFSPSDMESLFRYLSISFSPGHAESHIDFSRLSDGQKSMLYLSLVLTSQAIGRAVLAGENVSFDLGKLRPPVFTLIALEEPENSLSPHYLGRIVSALNSMMGKGDAQAMVATHAPSMLRRIDPEHIRYLRLTEARQTKVTKIQLPDKTDEAHKFVREAVQAFPEIYFSRLVVLGEGDSEEIVLPRILKAKGAPVDESAVTIAPLGGRHVNHFWRLLSALEIPYLTLLDLDVARYQGGWGRIKYVNDQFLKFEPNKALSIESFPKWNSNDIPVRTHNMLVSTKEKIFEKLEECGVFFSSPMDLDFSMLLSFPSIYNVEKVDPSESTINAVLGESHHDKDQYSMDELRLFSTYHKRFKLGSKPAAHIDALAQLSDEEIVRQMPESFSRLADSVVAKLMELPE